MIEASTLFFNLDMHDTCVQSKQQTAPYEPQKNYEWYGDNSYHPERQVVMLATGMTIAEAISMTVGRTGIVMGIILIV